MRSSGSQDSYKIYMTGYNGKKLKSRHTKKDTKNRERERFNVHQNQWSKQRFVCEWVSHFDLDDSLFLMMKVVVVNI